MFFFLHTGGGASTNQNRRAALPRKKRACNGGEVTSGGTSSTPPPPPPPTTQTQLGVNGAETAWRGKGADFKVGADKVHEGRRRRRTSLREFGCMLHRRIYFLISIQDGFGTGGRGPLAINSNVYGTRQWLKVYKLMR